MQKQKRDIEYLITGRPARVLLLFALPMMIGNIFQQVYQMADSVIVGRFVSQDALAAIGASAALTNIFICLAIGAGLGANVLTSRYFGARNYKKMKQTVFTSLLLFLLLSIALGIVGLFLSRPILILLNTPSSLMGMATLYLKIYFAGFPFLFMYNVLAAAFNALGRSGIPLRLLIFSSLLNIGLDFWMVGALHMGIAGAAAATLIAQGCAAVLALFLLLSEMKRYDSGPDPVRRFDGEELREILRLSVPSMIQQSTVAIGMLLVQAVVNGFGAEALAGYAAAVRVENIAFVPLTAMASAFSSYVSQNIGAGKKERIRQGFRAAILIDLVFACMIMFVMEVFPNQLIQLFIGDEGTAIARQTAVGYMTFLGLFFIILGAKTLADSALRGMGFVRIFLIANLINLGLRVGVAMGFAPRFGIQIVWYIVPVGWLIGFLISFAGYRRIRRDML